MHTPSARRRDAGLLTVAVVLAAAFLLAPSLMFGPGRLDDFPRAFVTYWTSGGPGFPPGLQHLVDHQFRYHLVRVVIAVPLLAVLVVMAVRFRRFRIPLGVLALTAAVLLIANVQGAVSPFGTLLPALASAPADADLTAVQAQIRDQLQNGPVSPALEVMLDEYVRWHVVKAVLTGLLAAALIGLSTPAWRHRRRRLGLLTAVPAVAALLVMAANVITVANPGPPLLLLLLRGGW